MIRRLAILILSVQVLTLGIVLTPSTASAQIEAGDCTTLNECGIIDYILIVINILSALVGIIVVIMIAVGGVQYTMARDNPQAVAAARQRIINALLALVVYLGMVAFLQWLVPGGVFSG